MKAMTNKKVADVLVDTLVAAGVKNIYGLAGDSLNGITDSIRTRDNIKWIPGNKPECSHVSWQCALPYASGEMMVHFRIWFEDLNVVDSDETLKDGCVR